MCVPRQRGAYKSRRCGDLPDLDKVMNEAGSSADQVVIDFCPHCLNGGSSGNVKQNLGSEGWKVHDPINDFDGSATRAGICGDPVGNDDHMIGGTFVNYEKAPIVATWKEGSAVDFSVGIDTNHNGYFEFFLCNLDKCGASDIDGKCFKNGHCVKLNRIPNSDCENPNVDTHQECGPIDDAYPGRFYVPCRKTDPAGIHIVGGGRGTMRYQLPSGFKCDHCVVQWYWSSANSCAPRGFLQYFVNYNKPFGETCPSDGGIGAHNPNVSECGGDRVPEEFWSCSDVRII